MSQSPAFATLHRRSMLFTSAAAVVGCCAGCPERSTKSPPRIDAATTKKPLVVLVVDDSSLAEAITREWRGRTEEDLVVRDVKLAEVESISRLPGDAVVFPSGLVGQFAEKGLIVPLRIEELESAAFGYRDIFEHIRLRELRWGGESIAAPLGSPQFMLCYREDIFQSLDLGVPRDWNHYHSAIESLSTINGDASHKESKQVWHATIEPLAVGWAGQTLLARAAGYAMHRDQLSPLFSLGTADPLIDQPPFVRALEELARSAKAAGSDSLRATPAEAFERLLEGQCGMAIAWPPANSRGEQPQDREGKLAFSKVPVGTQAFRFATSSWEARDGEESAPIPLSAVAGRVAAVSASSQDAVRASGFVIWLAGKEVSEQVAVHSGATSLFRHSQVAQSSRWTPRLSPNESRQYAESLAATLSAPRAMPGLTLPGRTEYLTALDRAVHEALDGKSAAEALSSAARRWREISNRLGLEAQRAALAHSLGQSARP